MRSRPSFPTSRRFASWANVRCGIGIAISLRSRGTSGPAQPIGCRGGARPSLPLPPTLLLEGADQPFLLEMVASQASSGRRPIGWVIVWAAYTAQSRSDRFSRRRRRPGPGSSAVVAAFQAISAGPGRVIVATRIDITVRTAIAGAAVVIGLGRAGRACPLVIGAARCLRLLL